MHNKIIRFLLVIFSSTCLFARVADSSAPYITGDTFRAYSTWIFDELERNIDLSKIKNGDTIFVKTDFLGEFFSSVHPLIPCRYILITHNSDYAVPGAYASYLNSDKIIAWFGQNIESTKYNKLHPIPIGVANQCWPHGNLEGIKAAVRSSLSLEKKFLLYMNFELNHLRPERYAVSEFFKDKPFVTLGLPKVHQAYLEELAQSKFVLSPPGNGTDCHRAWECLLVGAIPIIKSSALDSMFQDLPVLIINDWSEVAEDFLEKKYREMKSQVFNMQKAYFEYWANLIDSYKNSVA